MPAGRRLASFAARSANGDRSDDRGQYLQAVPDAVIDNPILNSPYAEPDSHWRFGEHGITNEVVRSRRSSAYFMPIAKTARDAQLEFQAEWTADRIEENQLINRVRERVDEWRRGGWPGVTATTRRLLEYWTDSERDNKLFFCQIEALETAIYVWEVAGRSGHRDHWILAELSRQSEDANPGLMRIAQKMATGTGKTVVMAMIIAWQALNTRANRRDARFTDSFLVVAPGITIRDRLRVLIPSSADNYYRARDLVPYEDLSALAAASLVITNFHALSRRDRAANVAKNTKQLLSGGADNPFLESPSEMVRRVCRPLGKPRRGIMVLNDEAHHCYRRRVGGGAEDFFAGALRGDDRKDADEREAEARIWISGLEAVAAHLGVKAVFDLSATPFFLAGSGYPEGTLFPWVVSDFSLIDAIESGLVKIPRVPVADDTGAAAGPVYRRLWDHVREELPRRGVRHQADDGPGRLPAALEGALHSLYSNYAISFREWESLGTEGAPPVFIVVCANTSVSKLVFDYVAGREKALANDGHVLVPGELPLFSNVHEGTWHAFPRTILVDSAQLESGEGLSAEFRRAASAEIAQFKVEMRERFPERQLDDITDEEILREVMNTVGKPGRLGGAVRCVVSVSMLTEGWDATTVTHILGVRAFSTQLLCEQVVGRGLRRRSYAVNAAGRFDPEYAEVYGVPFSFLPSRGSARPPVAPRPVTRVRALRERLHLAIAFPRVRGYRAEALSETVTAVFDERSRLELSTADVPSATHMHPIVGEAGRHQLSDLAERREQEVAYRLSRRVLESYWPDQPWLFPQLLDVTRIFIAEHVVLKDRTFVQLLLLQQLAQRAAEKIHAAVARGPSDGEAVHAVLSPGNPLGSTHGVDFDTTKAVMPASADKSHVSHVVCDTESWEQRTAIALEASPIVASYVKNERLGFEIPYLLDGEKRSYRPDFLVQLDDGRGSEDPLNVVLEVSGRQFVSKDAKVEAASTLWVPGVNRLGAFGRWAFLQIEDPWDTESRLRVLAEAQAVPA